MGIASVTRPDCDLCAKHARCDEQGQHCAAVLFAWADDREAPECGRFVVSVRAEIGHLPRSPLVRSRNQDYIIRRIR